MRVPSWILVTAAVLVAFPFGWGLGVFVAYLIAGKNFGQLPAMTVPLALIGSIIFALSPSFTPGMRLAIMLIGTVVFVILGAMM
jgi:hypothetical protein